MSVRGMLGSGGQARGRVARRSVVLGFIAGVIIAKAVAVVPGMFASDCGNELTVAVGEDLSSGGIRRQVVQQWNRRQGVRPARLVEISKDTNEVRTELKARAEAGSCAYDVLVLDVAWTPEFARGEYIHPIERYDPELAQSTQFIEAPLATGRFDGRQYAVPFATDVPLLYRRVAPGQAAPTSPEELWQSAAKGIKTNGEQKVHRGYSVQLASHFEGSTVNLLEAILPKRESGFLSDGLSGVLPAEDHQLPLNTPENREAVRAALLEWRTLRQNGTLTPGSATAKEADSLAEFLEGHSAYVRGWPIAYRQLAADPAMWSGGKLQFEALVPPVPGVLGGSNLAISAHSAHPEDAAKLIEFLTRADIQKTLFVCGGYVPVVNDLYRQQETWSQSCAQLMAASPGQTGSPGSTDSSDDGLGQLDLSLLVQKIHSALQNARLRPVSPNYARFSEIFRTCARAVVMGELSGDALDTDRFLGALDEALAGKAPSWVVSARETAQSDPLAACTTLQG